MTSILGDLFPKKTVNEPFLELNDPRWKNLEGGYKGTNYDASAALRNLELSNTVEQSSAIYRELWDELHHQGDVGIASYYAVPHMVRIAKEKALVDSNVLGLISLIEIQRHKDNPQIPKALAPEYNKSIADLAELVKIAWNKEWNLDLASTSLTALALAKGQIKLANAIQNLDDEDVIDEFLEMY